MRWLSIVIPAYNEAPFIGALLEAVCAADVSRLGFEKEVLVVNDGSTDRTAEIAAAFAHRGVRLLEQGRNQGKGQAVRRGAAEASGDYILIQDADLEYDPRDYPALLAALGNGEGCVYGSRILGQIRQRGWSLTPGRHPEQGLGPWLAGVLLTLWTALLYGRWITDTLTGYKLYPARILKGMKLETAGFETDHEITAKMVRRGVTIREVPIGYRPRKGPDGKKIRPRDGFTAVWTLARHRFARQ